MANDGTVVRRATEELVALEDVAVDDVVRRQSALAPGERHHGIRLVQDRIGGSNRHPVDAQPVPPAAGRVDGLVVDLLEYVDGSVHSPLVQAAVVPAQFESIHPCTDGNGRVGRALVHTVPAGVDRPGTRCRRSVSRSARCGRPTGRGGRSRRELADAGILRRRQPARGTTGYLAAEVPDLLDRTGRRPASTAFDPRVSPPNRPVPRR